MLFSFILLFYIIFIHLENVWWPNEYLYIIFSMMILLKLVKNVKKAQLTSKHVVKSEILYLIINLSLCCDRYSFHVFRKLRSFAGHQATVPLIFKYDIKWDCIDLRSGPLDPGKGVPGNHCVQSDWVSNSVRMFCRKELFIAHASNRTAIS